MTITARPVTHTAGGSLMPAGFGTAADGGGWIATRSGSAAAGAPAGPARGGWAGGRRGAPRGAFGRCRLRLFRSHGGGEAPEEIVRHLARHPVDQPRANLRELAADLRLNLIT